MTSSTTLVIAAGPVAVRALSAWLAGTASALLMAASADRIAATAA